MSSALRDEGNYTMDGSWGWMMAMMLIVLLAVVWIIRSAIVSRSTSDQPETILRQRFAHGEISEDEYRSRKNELERGAR